jgi:hypothetical protein
MYPFPMGKQIGQEKNLLTQRYIQNDISGQHGYLHLYVKKKSTQLFTPVNWRGKKPGDKRTVSSLGWCLIEGTYLDEKKTFVPST